MIKSGPTYEHPICFPKARSKKKKNLSPRTVARYLSGHNQIWAQNQQGLVVLDIMQSNFGRINRPIYCILLCTACTHE
jgi:hypothetical protein